MACILPASPLQPLCIPPDLVVSYILALADHWSQKPNSEPIASAIKQYASNAINDNLSCIAVLLTALLLGALHYLLFTIEWCSPGVAAIALREFRLCATTPPNVTNISLIYLPTNIFAATRSHSAQYWPTA